MKKFIAAVLLFSAFVTPTFAADSSFYAGAQVSDSYIGGFGGYQIDKMFSVEGHYYDFDSYSIPFRSTDVSSIGVAGVAMFPMTLDKLPPFSLFAKAGAERITVKTFFTTYSATAHDIGLTLGGGAQYDSKYVSARLGLDVKGEADTLYVSALYKF